MRHLAFSLGLVAICAAGTAPAHDGVQNAAVMARMHGMKEIGSRMAVLGDMAKGKTGFDARRARDAAAALAQAAAGTPTLFEPRQSDPKSEALPAIWQSFDDFTALSGDLERSARRAATQIRDIDSLRAATGDLGGACKACHSRYRE